MAHGDQGPRRLTLGRDRKFAGVCSGLAGYFDLDPTVVRIVFVLLVLFPFLPLAGGIVLYGALWLIMPEPPAEDAGTSPARTSDASRAAGPSATVIFGGFLLLLGLLFLFQRVFAFVWPAWWTLHVGIFIWPALLVVIGAVIMAAALRPRG
jgi:phage shock protein PspC (stress-responsive transcriptional regulator)